MPLLPETLRRALAEVPAPQSLNELAGSEIKLGALNSDFWNSCSSLSSEARNALVKRVTAAIRDNSHWFVLENRPSTKLDFDMLGLNARAKKALRSVFPQGPAELHGKTFGDLLEISNIGPKTALEIACAVEWASHCARMSQALRHREEAMRTQKDVVPDEVATFFRVLASWAAGELHEPTLERVLPDANPGWPAEIKQLWRRVGDCDADQIAGNLKQRYSVSALIDRAFADCDDRHRLILQARVFTTTRATAHEALAKVFGLSVAETRALEAQAMQCIERMQSSTFGPLRRRALAVRERLGSAVPERDAEVAAALNASIDGYDGTSPAQFEKDLLLWLAGPYRWDGGWLVAPPDVAKRSAEELMRRKDESGFIANALVADTLNKLHIHAVHHRAWVQRLRGFIGGPDGLLTASSSLASS